MAYGLQITKCRATRSEISATLVKHVWATFDVLNHLGSFDKLVLIR